MPSRFSNHKRRPNHKQKKKKQKLHDAVSIVGPDCVQVLRGELNFQGTPKKVALILFGESHFDAIDVTRSGGKFHAKYGWIETTSTAPSLLLESCKVLAELTKSQPLAQARSWATDWVDNQDEEDEYEWHTLDCQLLLLWFPLSTNTKTNKGKAYIVELRSEEFQDHDEDESSTDKTLPPNVMDWIQQMSCASDTDVSSSSDFKMLEWGDLDHEARELNKRRLSAEEIPTADLDEVIEQRKVRLKQKDSIWTFDDWFSHVQKEQHQTNSNNVHLILEASVPPWEVELDRSCCKTNSIQPAHDVIRCRPQDEEESMDDVFDPSNDGVGSYMDYLYRKFMNQMLSEQQEPLTSTCTDTNHKQADETSCTRPIQSLWLHCVDSRDLGCEAACHADSVKKKWNDLLLPEEHEALFREERKVNRVLFQPASIMNPELEELESLKSSGKIQQDSDEPGDEEPAQSLDFTFPSFEGFFGQCTDFMYYSPHVRLSYSPFLAKCVKSLETWEDFIIQLFFGGTIPEALELLDLKQKDQGEQGGGQFAHVRSPILKEWDFGSNQYIWKERQKEFEYISYPFFPHVFHLKAQNSTPPRTWSSQLYSNLTNSSTAVTSTGNVSKNDKAMMGPKDVAEAAKAWALDAARRHSADPKGADDTDCGGEWFAAFLRATHRDIYNDVDVTDLATLLQKNYLPSETEGRRKKHNVGKITIPNAREAFEEITTRFEMLDKQLLLPDEAIVSERVEALAKILIDIWVSNLVDFSTVLKIADIVSHQHDESGNGASKDENQQVVVVCYMGTAHVKAIADFYCKQVGFRKTTFVGKYSWDDDEVKTLKLPSSLWNLSELFNKK